jgi:hypothetical protein
VETFTAADAGESRAVSDMRVALADSRADEAQSLMDYWTARASLDHAVGATPGKGE